uniref:EGF-like domain-containing protein n=1 Tax=Magallana gigas TaxID=29159 RepID=A0A8W8NX13_MAGGI|nr:multiple epidermal growth factor-like domains protein 6 isoform X1 [Crassostrea gigas]
MDLKNVVYMAGFVLSYAYDDLSFEKIASQSYPVLGSLYSANNAVDRNTTTCSRTSDIGYASRFKNVWWKVDLGRVHNLYNMGILFKSYDGYEIRQRGRFAGFSLYVSTTDVSTPSEIKSSTLCYKDGPQLPPLNFTTTCTEHGRYVIFYNERLDGVVYPMGYELYVYTELCEVIVQGCNEADMYGSNCDIPCPTNCKYNTCHIQHGTCFGCQPGWTGLYCKTTCREGWFGDNCSQQCLGHCKDNTTCNHVTGRCDKGCAAGWTGIFCDNVCDDGTYGYNCVSNCSGHCLNGSHCNKHTGYCDEGCSPGYTDSDCSRECSPGYFGLDCNELCSGHCINNEPCDHVSGICPRVCMDGYTGGRCNISCQPGYYGKNCTLLCLPNCKTCRHTDGLCSCKAGWMGHNCSIECTHSYGENCQYPCSGQCTNQTCDRFNGNCFCDGKYDSLRNVETTDGASSTYWIVAFFISLLTNIGVISVTFIGRRKTFLKQKSKTDKVHFSCRSGSITEQTVTTDDSSYYQDLSVSKDENAYQTLHRH